MTACSTTSSQKASGIGPFFAKYSWAIVRNVIGWMLILLALAVAGVVPGPLGTPLFLIGFALISFPGKRRLTSTLLRGYRIDFKSLWVHAGRLALAVLLTWAALISVKHQHRQWFAQLSSVQLLVGMAGLALVLWWGSYWVLRLTNLGLRVLPMTRGPLRRWLKRHGMSLLPPRRQRRRMTSPRPPANPQILTIDPAERDRIGHALEAGKERTFGVARALAKPAKPLIGLAVTCAIFVWMLRPVVRKWPQVHDRVMATSLPRFIAAAAMFSLFLFVFRVTSWRYIVRAFGHRLPLWTSARIWSASELARYLPGAIWQVWGRAYLVKPYGVTATLCATSQVLELTIFLLANLMVALACLPWFADRLTGWSHLAFWGATALAPLMLLLLQPRVFYGLINWILRKIRRPVIEARVGGRGLLALLGWAMLGLCWQGLAIWLLLGQPRALDLRIDQLGLLVGAYCLAWCAGFIVISAPGGLGVREAVLVGALQFALPDSVRNHFPTNAAFTVMCVFVALLLRLWTIAGELMLSATAHLIDLPGALGRANAKGRVKSDSSLVIKTRTPYIISPVPPEPEERATVSPAPPADDLALLVRNPRSPAPESGAEPSGQPKGSARRGGIAADTPS